MSQEDNKITPERVESSEQSFIQEKIKKRPLNKKKLLKKLLSTVGMAILFGAVACITIICLEPLIGKMAGDLDDDTQLTQIVLPDIADEEETPVNVEISDEPFEDSSSNESFTEDNSFDETTFEETPIEDMILSDEENVSENEITVVVEKSEIELDDYQLLYRKMYSLNTEVSKSIVMISELADEGDVSIDSYSSVSVPGLIIGDNGKELLVFTYAASLKNDEKLAARFCDNKVYECELQKRDSKTGLAVYAVNLDKIEDTTKNAYSVAILGNSSSTILLGSPVLAVGDPMGTGSSLCYGSITSIDMKVSLPDSAFQILTTDIYGSTAASGFLVNVRGQIVGIICMNYNASDMKNLIHAFGISGIKRLAEDLSNNVNNNYLGLTVADVTEEAVTSLGVPQGAYIKSVDDNSPAMNVGINVGDVVTSLNDVRVSNSSDYIQMLYNAGAGQPVKIVISRYSQDGYKDIVVAASPEER